MKKSNTKKYIQLVSPLVLMAIVVVLFVIYRLGDFPRIPIYTWRGLKTAHNIGELVPLSGEYKSTPDLLVINSDHPLQESMVPPIVEYRETGVMMASNITTAYGYLSDYIRENMNNTLYIESSYRSFEDQQRVYAEEGSQIAALPGYSEHQSGMALDVYVMYFGGSAFINSDVGRFVNSSCGEFGFIIRYPLGKESITGFNYEPWHIRFVGVPHSQIIMNANITLEEYIDSLEIDVWYKYGDYLICRQSPSDLLIPSNYVNYPVKVSPDNEGYNIITIYTGDSNI